MNEALGLDRDAETVEVATMDKGYYKVDELLRLQQAGIKTVVADPTLNRNLDKLSKDERRAVHAALRAAKAKYGKALTRRRGMYVERSFEHVLDCGGARKTTLRGQENIKKRYLLQAMGCNLSLLMRAVFGIGTVKQALASALVLCMMIMLVVLAIGTRLSVSTKHTAKRLVEVARKSCMALLSALGDPPRQTLHVPALAG